MAKTAFTEITPSHEEIAAEAYEIYLRGGSQPGRDLEHWLQAESNLRNRSTGNGHANGNSNGNSNGNGNARVTQSMETRTISKEPARTAAPTMAQNTRGAQPVAQSNGRRASKR